MDVKQLLPNNIDAEKLILSAFIAHDDDQARLKILKELRIDDFYKKAHAEIFRAVVELDLERKGIDVTTISAKLKKLGVLDQVGGNNYLTKLDSPSVTNITQHVNTIKNLSLERKLLKFIQTVVEKREYGGVENLIAGLQSEINLLMERLNNNICSIRMPEAAYKTVDEIQHFLEAGKRRGINTGWRDFDKKVKGFKPGTLNVIAARSSVGKTAFALSAAYNQAQNGHRVGVFSMEMDRFSFTARWLSQITKIELKNIDSASIKNKDLPEIINAIKQREYLDLYLDTSSSLTTAELSSRARLWKLEKDIEIVYIDYLDFLTPAGKIHDPSDKVRTVTKELKDLAKVLNIPVVLLHQIRKDGEGRRPRLADLMYGGEPDSDVVIMLHREDYQDADSIKELSETEVIIAKNRQGETGFVLMGFHKPTAQFSQLENGYVKEFLKSKFENNGHKEELLF